jgi:hypothetical protein
VRTLSGIFLWKALPARQHIICTKWRILTNDETTAWNYSCKKNIKCSLFILWILLKSAFNILRSMQNHR